MCTNTLMWYLSYLFHCSLFQELQAKVDQLMATLQSQVSPGLPLSYQYLAVQCMSHTAMYVHVYVGRLTLYIHCSTTTVCVCVCVFDREGWRERERMSQFD